jgi:hypothetical protein
MLAPGDAAWSAVASRSKPDIIDWPAPFTSAGSHAVTSLSGVFACNSS